MFIRPLMDSNGEKREGTQLVQTKRLTDRNLQEKKMESLPQSSQMTRVRLALHLNTWQSVGSGPVVRSNTVASSIITPWTIGPFT